MSDRRAALLYDGGCPFCRWSARMLLAWDRWGRIRPVAIQSDEGRRLLADLSEARRLGSWHLVLPDGRRFSAGEAVPALMRLLPGAGPLAWLAARLPGPTQRAYGLVSRHRTTLAKMGFRADEI